MKVAIIDYNAGNLSSLTNSLNTVAKNFKSKIEVSVTKNPEDFKYADRLILPGVGDFSNCKKNLFEIVGMHESLKDYVMNKCRPILGICIGMQLMTLRSFERGTHEGLKFFSAEVKKLRKTDGNIRIPHMGWNTVFLNKFEYKDFFFSIDKEDFYFVHSFYVDCKRRSNILAYVNYGKKITAAICKDNIIGVQFHPEKSQNQGQRFLSEFLLWKP